jgi:hypothetical protein
MSSRAARLTPVFVALVLGCAHRAGRGVAESALESTQEEQSHASGEKQIARVAGERAAEGAVAALDDPAQQERIRRIVDAAVARAVASALEAALAPPASTGATPPGGAPARGAAAIVAGQVGRAATDDALGRVAAQLGNEGPLRQSLVTTGAIATDAAVGAALTEIFPGCVGDDAAAAACRRGRMQDFTRSTAASITAGVRDSIGWPLLLLAALVGAMTGVLLHWALTARHRGPRAFRPA